MKFVIEHRILPDHQMENTLLKEYEMAQHAFYELEKNTWQSASILVIISIGGVSLLLTLDQHTTTTFLVVTVIAVVSSIILWSWLRMTERWWSLQTVCLYRMEEIESELGMWKNRYIDYLDTTRVFKLGHDQALYSKASWIKDQARIERLDRTIRYYSTTLVRRRMKFLVILLIIGWMILIVRELLLTFPFIPSIQ